MLDSQSVLIIQKLLQSSFITKEELIEKSGLSKRQVEYGIEKVNAWLKSKNLPLIKNEYNRIVLDNETKKYLFQKFNEIPTTKEYILSSSERMKFIFLMMFSSDTFLSLNHFIYALNVSKSTVLLDLKKLSLHLESYNIKINYNRQLGYHLIGDEATIRYLMMKIIMMILSEEKNTYILDFVINNNKLDNYENTKNVVQKYMEKHKVSFVENRLKEFIYTFIFLRRRFKYKINMISFSSNNKTLNFTKEYKFSKDILGHFNESDENAITYLCAYVLGLSLGTLDSNDIDQNIIMEMVRRIIIRFESLAGIKFSNQQEIAEQIYKHFRSVYYRLNFKLPILNPLSKRVKEEYSQLYTIVYETMKPFTSLFNNNIPEDEIAFLTMHFASILSRFEEYKYTVNRKKALIVCPNGIGSSSIAYAELKALFPEFHFSKPIETSELDKVQEDYDIIFSTEANVRLFYAKKPCFLISPIMSTTEKYRLIRDVYAEIGKNSFRLPNITSVLQIIEKYADIKQRDMLENELYNYFLKTTFINSEKDDGPLLSEITNPSLIQLNMCACNWEEAIKISAAPLLKYEKITKKYIEAIIQTAKEVGPYIVITKHVALPHAKPEFGALELAISITTLENPIEFGNKENDPVKYIFCLSSTDNKSHIKAISELVRLLENQLFYKVLDESTAQTTIYNFIKDYEKNKRDLT